MRKSKTRPLLRAAILSLLIVSAQPLPAWSAPKGDSGEFSIGREDFFVPELAPVRQTGPYDVTIVYFMDYQCPACRKHTPDVARALKEERRVRVIYRDTPIFGARSQQAARAAIASQFQGRHQAMHQALMTADMPLDDAAIRAAAEEAGVDWARLQRDLKTRGDEIDTQIAWNLELSSAAGIAGTPAFVIGDTLANGALDYASLKTEIADARAEAGVAASPTKAAVETQETAAKELDENVDKNTKDAEPAEAASHAAATATPAEAPIFQKAAAAEPALDDSADERSFTAWPWLAALAAALGALFWWARSRSN